MSTGDIAYREQLPIPRRRQPAYGEAGPPPEVEASKHDAGPLDRRTEAWLAFAIVMPVIASYTGVLYGTYVALSRLL
jgi:hypothetical protein